ncbi:hypothetical protein ASG31_00465 [Chryseobacterium sp. Leaf404]|uniref:fimbrillin family protein n=1 Tax=unclassified Chryseobacterium TaxID=2593645 RepID=UPI0006FD6207|nr:MULTISPECIES: fimbrillin family protein [unclassified Chryseobacterium]KQT21854.1 hypothetical protein ASG31_00465 [Chryseobacterium sp. Leaf404]
MKKIFPIFIFALLSIFVVSCDNNDDVVVQEPVNNTARMRDVSGTLTAANTYSINTGINILSTDVVLVYRNYNSNLAGSSPVWQLLPKTYYLSGGRELDFNFLFDQSNVEIFSEANFDQATMSAAEAAEYKTNQSFRIVLVPADPAKHSSPPVDYQDYNAVVKYYNLDGSKGK